MPCGILRAAVFLNGIKTGRASAPYYFSHAQIMPSG
jgi:hypothetical protein